MLEGSEGNLKRSNGRHGSLQYARVPIRRRIRKEVPEMWMDDKVELRPWSKVGVVMCRDIVCVQLSTAQGFEEG